MKIVIDTNVVASVMKDCFHPFSMPPFQSFGDVDVYPSIQQKAVRPGFGLVKSHTFIDGNERLIEEVTL